MYFLVRKYILASGLHISSASLKPIDFGLNVVMNGKRGYPTMVKQIIMALESAAEDYVFFCEHDVLYHRSHFNFTPPRDDIFYYNKNVWRWKFGSNMVIRHDRMLSLSGMCANRELALKHYKLRDKFIKENGLDSKGDANQNWVRRMGYEPGTKKKKRGGLTDDDFDTWSSDYPIVDIRHKKTFSPSKMRLEDFKHKPDWWEERSVKRIPGWDLKKLFNL